jgi:hypothetical protein
MPSSGAGHRDFKGQLKQDGYSREEKYFNDLNRELIEQLNRARIAAQKPQRPPFRETPEPPKKRSRLVRILKRIFGAREGSEELF